MDQAREKGKRWQDGKMARFAIRREHRARTEPKGDCYSRWVATVAGFRVAAGTSFFRPDRSGEHRERSGVKKQRAENAKEST